MSHNMESQISDRAHQLLRTHHLGSPLSIYRMKPGYLWFNRVSVFFLFMIAFVCVCIAMLALPGFVGLSGIFQLFVWVGGLLYLLTIGTFCVVGLRNSERSWQIIVGEYGLLEIRRVFWKERAEIVYWEDIRAIKKSFIFPEYQIQQHRGEPFVLTPYVFQNGEELLSLVKEHKMEE